MKVSIMTLGNSLCTMEQELYAPKELVGTEITFITGGYETTYEIPEGTELYRTCTTDVYNASYAYAIYRYDWKVNDWAEIDSCVTYVYERAPRIRECFEDEKGQLIDNGLVQGC